MYNIFGDNMKIIDAHVHVCEHINGWGSRGELRGLGNGKAIYSDGKEFELFPAYMGNYGVTPERLIQIMDEHGVEKSVILQGNYLGFQNLYAYEAMKKYPDRFISACTIDPFCKNKELIAKNLFENLQFKIIKMEVSNTSGLMANHDTISLSGKKMRWIYELCKKYKLICVIDIGRPGNDCHQVKNLRKMIKKYSDVTFVVCHLASHQKGQYDLFKKNISLLNIPNCYFDLAALPNNTREEYPYTNALDYIKLAIDIVGEDKLMWGSDMPCALTKADYDMFIKYIMESDISDTIKEKIFYSNANNIYFNK